MRIDAFEEFPTGASLARAGLLPAPATVYLAAPDLLAYRRAAARLQAAAPGLEAAWWPVLPRSYWVSPFTAREELEGLARTLAAAEPLTVLLDLELPLVRPLRLLAGLPRLLAGRRAVRRLIEGAAGRGHRVVTAEYPSGGRWSAAAWRALGIAHPNAPVQQRIIMCYSSLIPTRGLRRRLREGVIALAQRSPGRVGVGLGTIAHGALGREPILSPEDLARDLERFAGTAVVGATIFRLGGLDARYAEVLRRYAAR